MKSICFLRLALLAVAVVLPSLVVAADKDEDWKFILEPTPPETGVNAWDRWVDLAERLPPLSLEDYDFLEELAVADDASPSEDSLAKADAILARHLGPTKDLTLREGEYLAIPAPSSENWNPGFGRALELARLQKFDATMSWLAGRPDRAIEVLTGLVDWSNSIVDHSQSLIVLLTGIAATGISHQRIEWLIRQSDITNAQLTALQSALATTEPGYLPGFAASLRGEFSYVSELIPELASKTEPLRFLATIHGFDLKGVDSETVEELSARFDFPLFDLEATLIAYGRPIARFVEWLESEPQWEPKRFHSLVAIERADWDEGLRIFNASIEDAKRQLSTADAKKALDQAYRHFPNPIGRLAVMGFSPPIDRLAQTVFSSIAQCRALALLIEMRKYQLRGEALPSTIEELAAAELGLNTTDPFSGELLRYDPERLAIWSVGANGVDDGGVAGERPHDGPDFVWMLKPANHDAAIPSASGD